MQRPANQGLDERRIGEWPGNASSSHGRALSLAYENRERHGIAVYFAATIGLIDLIDRGYRYSCACFLVVFLRLLLMRGAWLVIRDKAPQSEDWIR